VTNAEGVQAHPPLQVMEAVTAAAIFAPELHAHCVMYMLPASEVEELGHCLHGWFAAGFHWPTAHDDDGGGGAGGGPGHVHWSPVVHQVASKPKSWKYKSESKRTCM